MFKQYIFLLILSLFSIQGFAAGCPDGSEPVKSISADGTYFVFECGGSSNKIDFQIINLTDFEDSYFTDKADYASSKMINTITKNLVLIYPLGDFLSVTQNDEMDFLGSVHVSHERIIDDSQIKQTLQTVKKFLANKSCIDARGKNDLLNNIEWVLKNGFYSGLQAPLCRDVRFVMMSVSPEQRKDNNKELLRVFFHEIYHSLQNDLRNNCSGPNDLWVIEAAAEYFAKHSVSVFDNSQQDFVQSIFHEVVQNASRHGFKLEDPGVAEKGLGALRLKIEEGWLDESRILNGSLFHNCARVKEFQDIQVDNLAKAGPALTSLYKGVSAFTGDSFMDKAGKFFGGLFGGSGSTSGMKKIAEGLQDFKDVDAAGLEKIGKGLEGITGFVEAMKNADIDKTSNKIEKLIKNLKEYQKQTANMPGDLSANLSATMKGVMSDSGASIDKLNSSMQTLIELVQAGNKIETKQLQALEER